MSFEEAILLESILEDGWGGLLEITVFIQVKLVSSLSLYLLICEMILMILSLLSTSQKSFVNHKGLCMQDFHYNS